MNNEEWTMKRIFITLLIIGATLTIKAQQIVPPTASDTPNLEYVMQLYVTLEPQYTVGEVPHGKRVVIPITGGIFEGPKLKGKIIPGGADYQYQKTDGKSMRTELEAIYSIQTDDGVYIHVRNCGVLHASADGFYFFTAPKFEAPEDSPYAWLNNAIFVCATAPSEPNTVRLNIWKVVK
jgi:hypothetical protein